jgi:hypothetical protein
MNCFGGKSAKLKMHPVDTPGSKTPSSALSLPCHFSSSHHLSIAHHNKLHHLRFLDPDSSTAKSMDTRTNLSGPGNPIRDPDGNGNPAFRIDILDQETPLRSLPSSNTIEALAVAESSPYDVISGDDATQAIVQSSSMVSPPRNDTDDTALNAEVQRQQEQNGKLTPGIITCVHVYRILLNAFRK